MPDDITKIKITSVHEDGTVDVEVDEEFVEWFMTKNKLQEWDQERFDNFISKTLNDYIDSLDKDKS